MRRLKQWMTTGLLLCGGDAAFATLPLTVDEADTQDTGTFQIEAGSSYETDSECHHYDFPVALTYGVMPRWDIAAGFGEQLEQRTRHEHEDEDRRASGIDDLSLATKWMFLTENTYLPRQTISPSVTFPTANEHRDLGSGRTDYDLTWMASKSITEKMGFHVNAGYSWIGDPSGEDVGDIVHYGVAADYQVLESLQWIGEVFGEEELKEHETAWQYNTGVRCEVADGFSLVAAAGSRISGDAPEFTATTGLIWVLGSKKAESK